MPNLRNIIDRIINAKPDIVVRDFVGDTGAPHNGPLSVSPDVIVRPADPLANGQALFGGGATMGNAGLSSPITTGNYDIFIRVLNRGGAAANNVQAAVYWAPPADLVMPTAWHKIGTSTPATVLVSPASMTVLPKITWQQIPAPGHYCFVATVGCPDDPDPIPDHTALTLYSFDDYLHLIRLNNNITWRNFNVEPIPLNGMLPVMHFMAPGAHDANRLMQLEVVANLPEGAQLWLEGPADFVGALLKGHFEQSARDKTLKIPLSPQGVNRFQEMIFPAGSQNPLQTPSDSAGKISPRGL